MALTTIGRLNYNGIEFDGALEIQVNVQAIPDEAGMTIMYQQHTIKAHAIVTNAAGTDFSMQQIRGALMEPGRTLIFAGKGFGNDMLVSAANDVKNGPMPKMLSWTPIGANKAVEFDWEVVVCIARCGLTDPPGKIMAFNYELNFNIDEHGMTTRTATGHLQIRQGRRGRVLRDTADAYLNRIKFKQPDGYTRTQSRSLSKDKSRLDFTITDTQIRSNNPYPDYATSVRGRHRTRWQRGPMGAALLNTIDMEFSPTLGISGTQAWAYFIHLLNARIAAANVGGNRVFVDGLEADEDLFGTPCRFSVNYRILSNATDPKAMDNMVKGLVSIPGLWEPLDTSWTRWKASLADVFAQRGISGLQHNAGDLIVDLCVNSDPKEVSSPSKNKPKPRTKKPDSNTPYKPMEGASYLHYHNIISPSSNRPVSRQSVSQSPDYQNSQIDTGGGALQGGYPRFPNPTGIPDILQEGGQAAYSIVMRGMAQRAGWPIAKPVLKLADTSNVSPSTIKEVKNTFSQIITGSSFGVPVYSAVWAIEYALALTPGVVKPPKNIAEGLS